MSLKLDIRVVSICQKLLLKSKLCALIADHCCSNVMAKNDEDIFIRDVLSRCNLIFSMDDLFKLMLPCCECIELATFDLLQEIFDDMHVDCFMY